MHRISYRGILRSKHGKARAGTCRARRRKCAEPSGSSIECDTNVQWWRLGRSLSPPVESERIPFKGLQLKGKIGRSSLSKKGHVRIPPTRCDVVVNLLAAWPLVVGVVSNRRSCGFVVRPMLRERTGMCRASIGELRCGDVLAHVWNYKSCPTLFMGRRSSAPFNHVALLSMMVIDCCLSQ